MSGRIQFRSVLLITLVAVALSAILLFAMLAFPQHRRNIEDLSFSVARQTLLRAVDRLDELIKTATDHEVLYPVLVPDGKLTSDRFLPLLQRLWATVAPHEELAYLAVGIPETGEFAILRREPEWQPILRIYVRDAENGPEIRDYRISAGGVEFARQMPWRIGEGGRMGYDMRTRPFYQQAVKAGHSIWTDSYLFWTTDDKRQQDLPGVTYATPVYSRDQQLQLIWGVGLELRSLVRFLDRVQEDMDGHLMILEHRTDDTWRVLAESNSVDQSAPEAARGKLEQVKAAFLQRLPARFGDAGPFSQNLMTLKVDGAEWKGVCSTINGPDRPRWMVAKLWPSTQDVGVASIQALWFQTAFLVVGIVASISALLVSRYIAAPLQILEQQARQIVAGERDSLSLVTGPQEIERLSSTLNFLSSSLQQRQQSLQQVNSELRLANQRLSDHFELTPVGVVEVNREGQVMRWNAAAERIFGWRRDEILGQSYLRIVPAALQSGVSEVVTKVMHGKGLPLRNNNQNITKAGRIIDCEWFNTPLIEPHGEIYGIACLVLDVTDRNRAEAEILQLNEALEARVQSRTAELQQAIRDLEAFSYSVAHDLRTPLRAINGFSHALEEEGAGKLSADCLDYLQRIRNSSSNMGELIDALLRLSRVARQEMNIDLLDLTDLVRQSLALLRQTSPERKVELRLQPGLMVRGDRQLVRALVDNLCDNAWKYSSQQPETVIELFCEERADGYWFAIQDNGAGFDPEFADKATEPFSRLHRADEFEGHGIGLATAQRIALRHGGRVHLESRATGGATCWFRLPTPAGWSPPAAEPAVPRG